MFDLSPYTNRAIFDAKTIIAKRNQIPKQHPSIRGKFVVLRNINHRKAGDVVDSHNGFVHGIYDPSDGEIILFNNLKYFSQYVQPFPSLSEEELDILTSL